MLWFYEVTPPVWAVVWLVALLMIDEAPSYDANSPEIINQIKEISEIFDHADDDKDGFIGAHEIEDLLESMGLHIDDTTMISVLKKLDRSGAGKVSKERFIKWQLGHKHTDEAEDLKKTAKSIFKLFDADGSGSVTVDEFKTELDKLKTDLSIDEVVSFVREFDADGDGEISLEEFERIIESAVG